MGNNLVHINADKYYESNLTNLILAREEVFLNLYYEENKIQPEKKDIKEQKRLYNIEKERNELKEKEKSLLQETPKISKNSIIISLTDKKMPLYLRTQYIIESKNKKLEELRNSYKLNLSTSPKKEITEEDEDEDKINPFMKYEKIKVNGNINRVKSMRNSSICALWNDSPSVDIIDCEELFNNIEYQDEIKVENDDENINNFNKNKKKKKDIKYKKIFKKSLPQKAEGFAIDWNNITPFVLAVGGYDKKISIYKPKDENISDIILYGDYLSGHTDSVEDIQWSPNEENVLASCGIDRSIRFWDVRQDSKNPPKIIKDAHTSDVNVISWNTVRNHLFASGGDDNTFKVWDLRYITEPPITEIKWHTGPINSIMWDPFDESQLAVCSEDNRLSVWDFSVEPDEKKLFDNYNNEIPQQLVFLHQGQINLKDVKFHPVFKNMLISSAENGLNLFRPNFTDEASEDDNDEDDKMEEEKEINKNDQ